MKVLYVFMMMGSMVPWFLNGQVSRIMFYNAENYFDSRDDTLINDNEFLPDSARHWTYERFWRKAVRIYQVISAVDGWEMPAIVGLCEVENRGVLEKLVFDTPLKKYDYRIIHKDSPDPRGIDVAVIYRGGVFSPDTSIWLKIDPGRGTATREILVVKGELLGIPLHVFVNHWPSRSGGALASEPRRLNAAGLVRRSIDSLFQLDPNANIIIMGDFNDEPGNKSLQILTGPVTISEKICNLSPETVIGNTIGTIRHQGSWSIFDQVLVSEAVLSGKNGMKLTSGTMEIHAAPFLLEPDPVYSGYRPKRTYLGPNYHDGFSDHLPVSVSVELRTKN